MLMRAIIVLRLKREAVFTMTIEKFPKNRLIKAVFGLFLVFFGVFLNVFSISIDPVFAEPVEQEIIDEVVVENETIDDNVETVTENASEQDEANVASENGKSCQDSMGSIGWFICPVTGKLSEAIDFMYETIESILVVNPVEIKDGQPVYEMWKYFRSITNIVFIIFLLVVVYSQITGFGISNYGIKKALPKLIVMAILVNLSFIICSLLVDVSNIVGDSLRGVFENVETASLATMNWDKAAMGLKMSNMYEALAGGLTIGGVILAFNPGSIFMLVPVILGAVVAVASGLITIALRQAVVVLLIIVAPLAMVANVLPNTESLFTKWKGLLTRMLVFYPMFSVLFGASHLAGFAIIASAKDGFGLIIGMAVQIFPLFFCWKLMEMSGTVLGTINSKLRGLAAKPIATSQGWAESKRAQARANAIANSTTPSARLLQYLENHKALREADTKNAQAIVASRANRYTQRIMSGTEVADTTSNKRRASNYTRTAKRAKTETLLSSNAVAHTEHVLGNYGNYYNRDAVDIALDKSSAEAWKDYGRSQFVKEMDDENDINYLVSNYLKANKRDANNQPLDPIAYQRYIASVTDGNPDGEERLLSKIITQAAKVESKQRSEAHVMYGKYGHNGYNKNEYRSFQVGYMIDADGWAVDLNGERLRYDNGELIETVPGDIMTKSPGKIVLYNKRDEYGLYFDMKDQDGNIVARIHRGTGADGKNHDDVAFIKEAISNFEIPIGDPINNIFAILAGVHPGDIVTPQGQNDIGLARYSTTIGGALSAYKGDAAWAGAMFAAGVSNRQVKNSAQHAIWALDSIAKTVRPGALLQQSPASVRFLKAILDPDNWDKIFTDEALLDAVNIDNELVNGENWILDDNGNIIGNETVDNPTHEQRMNRLKRKFIFPAMEKILPAFDRMRTNETQNNQKQGTADAYFDFLKMVNEKWEGNGDVSFDPTLVKQDLQAAVREFRSRKHDKYGNPIYQTREERNARRRNRNSRNYNGTVLRQALEEMYNQAMNSDDLIDDIALELGRHDEYNAALARFEELHDLNPNATLEEIYSWIDELCILAD